MIIRCLKYESDDDFNHNHYLLSQLLNILSQLLNNSDARYLNIQIIVTRVKLIRSQKEYIEESI